MENQNYNLKNTTSCAFLKTLYNLIEVSRITSEGLHIFHLNLYLLTIHTYLLHGQDVILLLARP